MIVACPSCFSAVTLPDPWLHPGFTCPICFRNHNLPYPVVQAPPPPVITDTNFSYNYRNRTSGSDSFWQSFGDRFGTALADLLIVVMVGLGVLALIVIAFAIVKYR